MQACSQRQSKLTFTQVTLFLEEPINFKLSWLLIVFCQFAASFVLNYYSLNSENVHVNLNDHVFKVILESNSECSVSLSKDFFAAS